MGLPVRDEVLCPRCGVPMVPAAGLPGTWQCPDRSDHEFFEDVPDEEFVEAAKPKKHGRAGGKPDPPERCPKCRAPMKTDDLGAYCDSPVHKGVYRPPKEHWLAHIGITTALPDIPQANIGDGGACLIGPLGHGGGGSSGRKRKKPVKRSKGPAEFWDV